MYRSIVGALQYVTMTHPNIAFVVNKACQFIPQPITSHWLAVKRILKYLQGVMSEGLLIQPSTCLTIEPYLDAD